MASVLLRAICGRPQSSRMAIPHSASEGNTDFFAVLLVFSPTDHADFQQMQIHTACEKSVSICRTSGAICGLTNHPAWHLCCSARSVGEFSHVLFQAHRALSCLPQISQICTDAFHVQPAKESVLIRRAGGASKTKQ